MYVIVLVTITIIVLALVILVANYCYVAPLFVFQQEEAANPNIDFMLISKCKAMIKVCH